MRAWSVVNSLNVVPSATAADLSIEPTPTAAAGNSIWDKISDVIPGDTGQKGEDFDNNAAHKAEELAKEAGHKAEEAYDAVKDKLSGLFGGDKK